VDVFVFAVVLDIRHVVVDDVHDVTNIKTSTTDTSCNEDGAAAVAERSQGVLAFALGAIRVDGCRRKPVVEEVVVDEIDGLLRANKHQGAGRRHGDEKVVEGLHLLRVLDPNDLLSN
jgi:hypothetical protein